MKITQKLEEATIKFNNKFTYMLKDACKVTDKIVVICPYHGEFTQEVRVHLRSKHGCPECANKAASKLQAKTTEQFIKEAKIKHNNKYTYNYTFYTGDTNKVTITCPIHGDFEQAPYHHLRNRGCPSCSVTGFDTNKSGILYYLKILGGQAYKIGITNKSVKERFTAAEFLSIEILKVWYYENGLDAYKEEQKILKSFYKNRYVGPGLLKSGNTELFYTDVLNLNYP